MILSFDGVASIFQPEFNGILFNMISILKVFFNIIEIIFILFKQIWIVLICGPIIAITPDYFATAAKKFFKPNPVDLISRLQNKND